MEDGESALIGGQALIGDCATAWSELIINYYYYPIVFVAIFCVCVSMFVGGVVFSCGCCGCCSATVVGAAGKSQSNRLNTREAALPASDDDEEYSGQ